VQADAVVTQSFVAPHCRRAPDVGNPDFTGKLGPHGRPFLAGHGVLAVAAEIGAPQSFSVSVHVVNNGLKRIGWREIPQVVGREILTGRGIADTASFVGQVEWQPAALPFTAKPLTKVHLQTSRRKTISPDILNTNLRNHRKFSNRLRVAVASDMTDALVPNVAIAKLPPACLDLVVAGGPSLLRIPEPEGRTGKRTRIPSLEMRFIPIGQASSCRRFSGILAKAIRPVRHDDRGRIPSRIPTHGIAQTDMHSIVSE
jgi:hypothetical protein